MFKYRIVSSDEITETSVDLEYVKQHGFKVRDYYDEDSYEFYKDKCKGIGELTQQERAVIIQPTEYLGLAKQNVVYMKSSTKDDVNKLIRTAMRMNPDHIYLFL